MTYSEEANCWLHCLQPKDKLPICKMWSVKT